MKLNKPMYKILSPDGFKISPTVSTYKNLKQVKEVLKAFTDQFKHQGYYSQTCYNGYIRRISIQDLPDYCEIIKI